jgi:hypothetical protein
MVWYNYRNSGSDTGETDRCIRQTRDESFTIGQIPCDWTISADVPQGGAACGGWISTWLEAGDGRSARPLH